MKTNVNGLKISDIAKDAGVSIATVSRVLNQSGPVKRDTFDKVIASVKKLGYAYEEASPPAPHGTRPIIVNLPSLENPFYSEVVRGIKASAARHGFHVLISEDQVNRNTLAGIIEILKKSHACGLITMNQVASETLAKLSKITTVIQCCEYNESVDLPFVTIDDLSASTNVMEYLLSRGRKKIAFISGPESFKYAKHRLQGYKAALDRADIAINPRYIIQLPDVNYDIAISAAMQLLDSNDPPDAFFTCSDVYAAAVVRAAFLAGFKVPQDVMISGFDNIPLSAMSIPSITTVNQPKTQIGYMAGELLVEKIMHPNTPNRRVILDTELIVRESTS